MLQLETVTTMLWKDYNSQFKTIHLTSAYSKLESFFPLRMLNLKFCSTISNNLPDTVHSRDGIQRNPTANYFLCVSLWTNFQMSLIWNVKETQHQTKQCRYSINTYTKWTTVKLIMFIKQLPHYCILICIYIHLWFS